MGLTTRPVGRETLRDSNSASSQPQVPQITLSPITLNLSSVDPSQFLVRDYSGWCIARRGVALLVGMSILTSLALYALSMGRESGEENCNTFD